MALRAVCVDRARLLRKESSAVRVEGSTSFVAVPGQWFRCRLFLTQSTDAEDPSKGHFSSTLAPQLLCVRRDLDGSRLHLHGDERVEINSRQFGRTLWRMQGEPQPLRKRRRVIGWLAFIERVVEREYDDLLHQNVPDIYAPLGGLAGPTPTLAEVVEAESAASVELTS